VSGGARKSGEAGPLPVIEIYDHQDAHSLDPAFLLRWALASLPFCRERCVSSAVPLAVLEEIEISLVDDATIARVHAEFMDDSTATDVITFDHGEILISTETAARQAPENGNRLEREIATYMAHGLLHLAGYGDGTPEEYERMRTLQERAVQCGESVIDPD
jgi:probable rRNA maturation factor